MFVESNRPRRNPKTNFIYYKELPAKGSISERLAISFLERFDNPTVGDSAYKNFFQMSNEKNFVSANAVCVTVTSTPNLQELATQLGLQNSTFIKLYFKHNKVTASCRKNGRTYGAKGNTLQETLQNLVNHVYSNTIN